MDDQQVAQRVVLLQHISSIVVSIFNGPANQFANLLVGDGMGVVANPPGSVGTLCITGGTCLCRYAKDILNLGAGGMGAVDIRNPISNPCGGAIVLEPGAAWNFQWWHRQPMGQPATFSAALAVTFR